MHKTFKLGVIALTLVLPVVGCDSNETIDLPIMRFSAALTPQNAQLGNVTGTATIEIAGDQMRVTVNATGLDNSLHLQLVGSNTSCPTIADDTNQDGFVDIQEGLVATGAFLLALDT